MVDVAGNGGYRRDAISQAIVCAVSALAGQRVHVLTWDALGTAAGMMARVVMNLHGGETPLNASLS